MAEGVSQLPEVQGDLLGKIEGELGQLKGEVFDSVKLNVLDKFKLTEVVLKSEDFADGKLKPENFEKIKKELKTKVDGVDLMPVLTAAKIAESIDVQPVKDFFVERAMQNLGEKIEKELAGYSSFTQVKVIPKDLLQFDLKVEGVKKVEAGTDETKEGKDDDEKTEAQKEEQLASEAEEKGRIKTALGKAGFLVGLLRNCCLENAKIKMVMICRLILMKLMLIRIRCLDRFLVYLVFRDLRNPGKNGEF